MKRFGAPSRDQEVAGGALALASLPGIAGLFTWWQRQIWSLLPDWARLRFTAQDAIIVHIRTFSHDPDLPFPATGDILVRRSGQEEIAAELDFSLPFRLQRDAADAVILRLPPEMVLQREMTVPIAAERDLPSLIHFQMPRLTPFEAAEVFWGISEPVRDGTRLKVTLHVVQRSLVDRLLDPLAGIGLKPSILEDSDGGIALARLGSRKAAPRGAGPVICGVLATACLLIPLISQQTRLDAAGYRLRILAPVQRQIMQLHGQIADLTAAQILIAQAQQSADVLHTLALLTGALPDGTWLNDLTVNGDSVTFDGQSANAAQLISVLAATPGLKNVGFDAPVTRTPGGGADMFSIELTISR